MAKTPKTESEKRWGDGRAAFVARLDEIKNHLGLGRSLRSYYDANKSDLVVSYDQVRRYATRYIRSNKTDGSTASSAAGSRTDAPDGARAQPVGAPRFVHHPAAGDSDDLI